MQPSEHARPRSRADQRIGRMPVRSWRDRAPRLHPMSRRPGRDVTTRPRSAAGPCSPPVGHGPAPRPKKRGKERTWPWWRRHVDSRKGGSPRRPRSGNDRRRPPVEDPTPKAAETPDEAVRVVGPIRVGMWRLLPLRSAGHGSRGHRLDQRAWPRRDDQRVPSLRVPPGATALDALRAPAPDHRATAPGFVARREHTEVTRAVDGLRAEAARHPLLAWLVGNSVPTVESLREKRWATPPVVAQLPVTIGYSGAGNLGP